MEITCQRCHQPIPEESCYCPSCGLPQLVYTAEEGTATPPNGTRMPVVRDASSVDWKVALKYAAIFGIPAGILCNGYSPLGLLGFFWMSAAGAWAVSVYVRRGHPAWVTTGAGARIGLVTGILAAWLAFAVSGGALYTQRYVLHHGAAVDAEWSHRVDMTQEMTAQLVSQMGSGDQSQLDAQKKWMLSPWGHAGIETFGFVFNGMFLLFFATIGGAISARLMARRRRPEV